MHTHFRHATLNRQQEITYKKNNKLLNAHEYNVKLRQSISTYPYMDGLMIKENKSLLLEYLQCASARFFLYLPYLLGK